MVPFVWPIYTLKQLQEFLGTVNYVRPHCGPEYTRIADPLRALLKPGASFTPNDEQAAAIQGLKDLVLEHHRLCVPDEAAAIRVFERITAGRTAVRDWRGYVRVRYRWYLRPMR